MIKVGHGTVEGDTYHKQVRGSIHKLRKPEAWAMDIADLRAAQSLGALYVCIHDTEKKMRWWAGTAQIWTHGLMFDRGHGQQIALAVTGWKSTKQEAATRDKNILQDALLI